MSFPFCRISQSLFAKEEFATVHAKFTQSLRLRGFSPEQLTEVVRGARLEHFILSRAKCDAQLTRWSFGDFTVDTGHYSFPARIVGSFAKGRLCLGYMRRQSAPSWVNGLIADNSTVEFYPDGAEVNYCAAPGAAWVAIVFTEDSLQTAARSTLGHEVALPWKHVVNFCISQSDRGALDGLVNRLWTHPVSGTAMITPILGAVAEILDAHQQHSPAGKISKPEHRQAILKRADDFLHGHLSSPFRLESLASATGTTVRTLQRVFRDAYGLAPHEWARCLALHRARQTLRSPAAHKLTVQGIARDSGFRHMGRFSEYYRELFDELPSITLTTATR